MKRLAALLCISFFFCLFCQAQKTVVFQMDTVYNQEKISLPFKDIIVADARFDQTKLGGIYNKMILGMLTTTKRDVVFPDSLKNYLPYIIKSFSTLSDTSSKNLYILVKKFRVAENFMTSIQGTLNNYFTLNISASFYAIQNDQYKKLFSIEDVFLHDIDIESDVKLSLQYNKNQRASILKNILYKLMAYKDWNNEPKGPLFSTVDVETAIQKRFMLPVYTQQAVTGLYKTFLEFKNASPSVTSAIIIYKNGKVQNVVDQNHYEIRLNDYWGLSDGTKNYLIFRNELTELIPCGKSFRLLSYRTKDELSGRATVKEVSSKDFFTTLFGEGKVREYFDLDMDTGEIFMEEIFGKSSFKNIDNKRLK
ncbi:MAG: hypothetical protein JWR72_613 [Flavisolibacter sp.]|nr:hypothetical protein [Flavisolibacter sp.]